ncbi:MAG: HAMP domain-containing protein [Rhodopseudomonas sp.]|nr:HAMP domain-containing protein [Rhodopseudomonas sp.]
MAINVSATASGGASRIFNDRKISTKIMLGFACVLAVTATISVGAYIAFDKADDGLDVVVRSAKNLQMMTDLERNLTVLRTSLRAYAQNSQAAFRDKTKNSITSVASSVDVLAASIINPARKKAAEDLGVQFGQYVAPFDKIVQLREQQTTLTSKVVIPAGNRLRSDFIKLREVATKDADALLLAQVNEGMDTLMQMRIESVRFTARHDEQSGVNATALFTKVKKLVDGMDPIVKPDGRAIYTDLKAALAEYREGSLKGASENAEQRKLEADMDKLGIAFDASLASLKGAIADNNAKSEASTRELMTNTSSLIVILAIGGLLVGALLAWIIGRAIARPIVALVPELEKLAAGDFKVNVPGTGRRDEVGQIADAVAEMARRVSHSIGEIISSGREVTNASAEISTSTSDLSQRTEEQAASIEETSAAMEELASTVRKNAENAQMANSDANATRDVADRGGKVVAQAVQAMAKIEDSSRKIGDIIGVIDEIARQTNLLALNAAVEAARAGEAGRGFAVVASEVRSLAQRSSQAAKDIKDLITNSNGQVKDGVALVNRAGESLTEIVESINKVAAVVADIANASSEQATGIEQINKALNQMDEATQQNSALVEENAATAKTLEHQAQAMDEQVAFFQIAVGDGSRDYGRQTARRVAPVARPVAKPVAAKPAPAPAPASTVSKRPAAAPQAQVKAGPARNMQTALAKAINDDDWKEF